MKKHRLFLVASTLVFTASSVTNALGARLQDEALKYEVLFTNPLCPVYRYSDPVETNGGGTVTRKPKNAYCTKSDSSQWNSSSREKDSPQRRIIDWIEDSRTNELFLAFLSFSNSTVNKRLCQAADNGVKITFVMDDSQDKGQAERLRDKCGRGESGVRPKLYYRGHSGSGSDQIKYAHNKIIMANPGSDVMRVAFGSGNMSSGTNLHHENWHFITLPSETYFAQIHLCVKEAMESDSASNSISQYAGFMDTCRSEAQESYDEESDIKAFFIPNRRDTQRLQRYVSGMIEYAENLNVGAHRFSSWWLLNGYRYNGETVGGLFRHAEKVRIIVDDDVYWAGKGVAAGDNSAKEASNVRKIVSRGGDAKYMETNHDQHLLHHNKFIIANRDQNDYPYYPSAVLAGAANLTDSGFGSTSYPPNYENIYYIMIPSVVQAFNQQYGYMWEELATSYNNLPVDNEAVYKEDGGNWFDFLIKPIKSLF